MTDAWPYTPVVRLPKRRDSTPRANRASVYAKDTLQHKICEPENCLVSDTLYIVDLADSVREADVRTLLQHCLPSETKINRHQGDGYLRFSDAKLADRAYSLYNGFTFTNGAKLRLRITKDGFEPEPSACILKVKQLPLHVDNNTLYDIFRPFGPLGACQLIMEGNVFRGTAFVQFFQQSDSDAAQAALHGKLFDGNTLVVEPLTESTEPTAEITPKEQHSNKQNNQSLPMLASSKKQAMDKTPGPNVDILNLYIKNLDPSINNNELTMYFKKFGHIVSARVMTNPNTGQSRGYGFVSFSKPEEAEAALNEMNGKLVASKPLYVSYHEPKKTRQNNQQVTPLRQQNQPFMGPVSNPMPVSPQQQQPIPHSFPGNNHVGSSLSLNASSFYPSPDTRAHRDLQSVYGTASGLGIEHDDQIKDLAVGQKQPIPSRKLSAAESLVFGVKHSPQFSSSPVSGTSTGRSLETLTGGMSIKRPPLQQQAVHLQHNGHPTLRRRGSIESISSVMTETSANRQRQKLTEAVIQCIGDERDPTDIVDMLLTLKRKERSLCLFNPDFLRDKIQLAMVALDTFNEEEEDEMMEVDGGQAMEDPYARRMIKMSPAVNDYTPRRVSKAINIVAPPPPPPPEISVQPVAEERVEASTEVVPKQVKEIEDMLAAMNGKPIYEKKQQMGDRLFPLVKATGVKQAPKVTIRLLDTIDLHELARIMYDKEKLTEHATRVFAALQKEQ